MRVKTFFIGAIVIVLFPIYGFFLTILVCGVFGGLYGVFRPNRTRLVTTVKGEAEKTHSDARKKNGGDEK